MNSFDNISDPVEILKVMYREKDQDAYIKEPPYCVSQDDVCGRLDSKDSQRLLEFLFHLTNTKRTSAACSIAQSVRLMTSLDLDPFLEVLVQKKFLGHSPFLFYKASADIRDQLIQRVDINPSWVLSALAWIGDEKVVDCFTTWRDSPPDWTKSLFCGADRHAFDAGWEVTKDGTRRELCFNECIPLMPSDGENEEPQVKVFTDAPGSCPSCGRNLAFIFSVDGNVNAELQHPALQRKNQFLVCEACVSNVIYTQRDPQGRATWSSANDIGSYSPMLEAPTFPRNIFKLSDTLRDPLYSAISEFEKGISQIGGHPSWLQDPDYPSCPKCDSTMKFFGQVTYEDAGVNWEGTFYSFMCDQCKGSLAVTFQFT